MKLNNVFKKFQKLKSDTTEFFERIEKLNIDNDNLIILFINNIKYLETNHHSLNFLQKKMF